MKKFTLLLICAFASILLTNQAVAGTGTKSDPYSIAEAIVTQDTKSAWVRGYIVGAIRDDDSINKIADGSEIVWGSSNVRPTAVLLADDASVTDYSKCVVVNLPTGDIRIAVNLKDNPSNIGQNLKVYGTLRTYFSIPGVRDLTDYSLGEETNPEPQPGENGLSETFETSQGNFSIVNVTLPGESSYIWKWDTYGYMKASSFIGGSAKESEGWLISPAINLTGKASAMLSFEHTGKYFSSNKLTEQEVMVSTNYSEGAPSSATWTKLTISNWPTGNDWNFVNSGNINLSSVVGNENVRIAFKYMSSASEAATWEIKNVIVKTTDETNGIDTSKGEEFSFKIVGTSLIISGIADGTAIDIYDMAGLKIQSSIFNANQIELNKLSKGIYVFRIEKHIQKFIF